jgi:hypothetical protein
MKMSKPIDTIMQKEMTRKEFIATMGFGVASILGFSSILQMLTGKSLGSMHHTSRGYGSSSYGQ